MKKRFIGMLLSLCLILSICTFAPLTVSAETSGTCGGNLTWVLDDGGTLTISGEGTMLDWSFSSPWGDVRERISEIVISNGVSNIGHTAFYGCESLTNMTIPDSVTTIGDSVFEDCKSLTSVTIPDGVTTIGICTFKGCESLTSVTIPDSVTTIGHTAFYGCESLTSVTIPNSVTTIGHNAFDGCESLTSVTIPDGVTTIGGCTFWGCESLTSVTIADSVTTIEMSAFANCNSLQDVYYIGSKESWENISIDSYNDCLTSANIHYKYISPTETLTISAPTNSYAGTYYTFEAALDTMPTSAFLQFDSPADGWTWFSDEYCSTNPVFNIPTDEIVEKDGKYVYQTSFVIYSSGNASDSYNRQVRVAADINGTRQYSEGAKFVVQPTPERQKNTIGYLYEQTSNPSGDTLTPEIKDVEVAKTNGKYRLTIKDITAENEDWVFFYWQTDNGEFEKVTDDFKTVDLTVSGDANVTITMGDGCGYITTKTIEIN